MHLLSVVWCGVVHLLARCYLLVLIRHLILWLLMYLKRIKWCTIWLYLRFPILIHYLLLRLRSILGNSVNWLIRLLQYHVVSVLWFLLCLLLVRLIDKLLCWLSIKKLTHWFHCLLLLLLVLVCFLCLCLSLVLATQLMYQFLLLLYLMLKLLESLVLCILKVCIWHVKLAWKLVHLILRRLIHIIKRLADKAVSWAMHLISKLVNSQLWIGSILKLHPISSIIRKVILILKINWLWCPRHLEVLCTRLSLRWTDEVWNGVTICTLVLIRLWLVAVELHVVLEVIVLAEVHSICLIEGSVELSIKLIWHHAVHIQSVEIGVSNAWLTHV